jgi:hypothetical protein
MLAKKILAGSSLVRMAGLDPAPKKKSGPGLGFRPSRPKFLFAKGVFGKTHPYALAIILMPILI